MNNKYDIRDDELRVVGHIGKSASEGRKFPWWAIVVAAPAIVAMVLTILLIKANSPKIDYAALEASALEISVPDEDIEPDAPLVFEPEASDEPLTPAGYLGNYSSRKAGTEVLHRTVNDIPLTVFIPHYASAELCVGAPDSTDTKLIFATQAADIRADNGKINGAFVLKGQPLAWGLSKKGYAAIIGRKITVGVADNSPLFEEATERGGYFFRQYPLVADGRPIDNKPKGKSIRRALCDRNGEILVIATETPESFHDFACALSDFGVDQAIYLIGTDIAYGFWRDASGHRTDFCKKSGGMEMENYLVWRGE